MSRCRWVYDKDVPGGRYLVPGCMNRAVHDDDGDCHCEGGELTIQEEVQMLRTDLAALRATLQPDLLIPETRPAPVQESLI